MQSSAGTETQEDVEKFMVADPLTPCVIGFYNEDTDGEVSEISRFPLREMQPGNSEGERERVCHRPISTNMVCPD